MIKEKIKKKGRGESQLSKRSNYGLEPIEITMNLPLLILLLSVSASSAFRSIGTRHLRHVHTATPKPKGMTVTSLVERGSEFSDAHHHLELGAATDAVQEQREEKGRYVSLVKTVLPLVAMGATLLSANAPALANGLENTAASLGITSGNDGGFLQSFLLIFISEIGDKTFFIAGLLAAKYGRFISFTGSIGALAIMTVLSTILGQIFHAIPPSLTQGVPYDDVVAVVAFAYFGLKTLYDSSKLEDEDNSGIEEEKAEAEEVVENLTQQEKRESLIARITQTFGLVFAAEIGDRSFLSTIALSAALNPYAVATGAIAAHASATGIAVAGGVFLSKYLSEKVIGYISAALFLIFAATTALGIF